MKDLKKRTSRAEQIALLKKRGMIIDDAAVVNATLTNVSYYRLSGYLHNFKQKDTDEYICGLSWERVKSIYDFDRKLTRILMFALEDIEETFKTRLSYVITEKFPNDPIIYLKPNIYRNYDQYIRFLSNFYLLKERNQKLPFVKHHDLNYYGFLPMWVAVELLTMGNLWAIYDNLQPKYQKEIARLYNTGPLQLSSWLRNLTYTRNHLAHYMRLYNFNFGRTPMKCKKHSRYSATSNMIFDQLYVIGCMYSDRNEWNCYVVPELEKIILEYQEHISLECIGFPSGWRSYLAD